MTSAIVGASSPQQVPDLLASVGFRLEEARDELDAAWYGLPRPRPDSPPTR